jgi:myosin heavy subunit
VAQKFVTSMDRLAEALSETKCSFVRCIKPNAQMQRGVFDRKCVCAISSSAAFVYDFV